MTKNEIELVKALGELEGAIASICKVIQNKVGQCGYENDLNKKLEAFKDKFYTILLDELES